MELSLILEFYRPGGGEGEGEVRLKFRPEAQPLQGVQFPVQLLPAVQRVDKGVLLLKAAVYRPAERAVFLQRPLVGLQVEPGPVRP